MKGSSSEAGSKGHASGAGAGRKGSPSAHKPPPATAIAVISSSLLAPALAIAFHDACISAASSTSSVTSTGRFIAKLEDRSMHCRGGRRRDAGSGDREVVLETGRDDVRHFRKIIPAPQFDGILCIGLGDKFRGFVV